MPDCVRFIEKGTPKQAKQAVKCLYMNTTATKEKVLVLKEEKEREFKHLLYCRFLRSLLRFWKR